MNDLGGGTELLLEAIQGVGVHVPQRLEGHPHIAFAVVDLVNHDGDARFEAGSTWKQAFGAMKFRCGSSCKRLYAVDAKIKQSGTRARQVASSRERKAVRVPLV
jgi:hypothetical protein